MVEIEQIGHESKVGSHCEASTQIFKLTAMYDGSRSAREGITIKLGYISHKNKENNLNSQVAHEANS